MKITTYPKPSGEMLNRLISKMWPALEFKKITVQAQVREAMEGARSYLYLAADKLGKEVGFALVQQPDKETLFLLLMWVHEAHRGQGIGKKLFEKSQQQGKSLRARFLWLGTPKYGGAVPFYEKLGPHARNEDNYQYKETVIVQFAWKLDPSSQQTWDPFGLGDNLPFIDRVPDLEDGIRNILQVTKIPEAAYWVLDRGNVDKGDISAVKPGLLSRVTKYQGTKVFAMGSITKPFFAYALHRAIKDNPGKIKASDLVSDHLNIDLSPYQTTIHQMLCHRNGLPGGNEMIIGPGDVLLAPNDEDSFLAMAQKAFNLAKVEFTRPDGSFEDRDEYSNLNYACLAILVEKKIGLSAPDLITKYVIEPFELRHTYVLTPEKRVPCYVVHTDGTQIRTEPLDHSGNAYTFAAMGMYSCREDLGKFLQQLLNEPLQIPVIFGRCNEERANHYYPIGLFRPLNKIAGSDWSLNRYKCPSQDYSLGRLPKASGGVGDREGIWQMQGHVTGYSTSIAISPQAKFISVVLTNASGPVDASDHIMRLILQRHLELSQEKGIVDVLARTREGYAEAIWWQNAHFSLAVDGNADDLIGLYEGDAGYNISIYKFKDGKVRMKFIWGERSTPPLQIREDRQGNERRLTIVRKRDPIELGIDVFLEPKNMSFEVRDAGNSTLLTRWGRSFVTTFQRTHCLKIDK